MRVLLTSAALCGHFYPLVPLAWTFRGLGHEVLVAVADDFVPEVLRAGLPAASCGPAADFAGLAVGGATDRLSARRYGNGRVFGRNAARNLPGLLSIVDSWRPDLVLGERAEAAGPVAAAAAGVPAVELQWGIPLLREYRIAAEDELEPHLDRLGVAAAPPPMTVLNPWPPSLRRSHAVRQRRMRNVPYDGQARVPNWVWQPRKRPRICLTLGTVLPRFGPGGGAEVVMPMLHALARLDVEVVVAVEDEVVAGWPPLPAVVTHAGRLPLSHVLRACDVTVHHGGQGTSLTALGVGIPQLVLPVFDDQLDNAAAVVLSGAGLSLPPGEADPAAVADRCAELLERQAFQQAAAAIATEIATQPSLAAVAVDLTALVGPARRLNAA
ncbi:nucleotide disphospho-sugar-binding domain-containing protein [Amycolatopsis sp. WQ 127309]|uniref:nucleotide disphospho-sugar-binding domain-containing protein n=1 Tax=Amycolatopsis sp. WQ 127309 TaxID=2932773 RepID=UPI002738EFE7|nr:nucleotide disphospho-sugar-binding domain-containing protein [Amycolatopsis sp. WQ 127309]